MKRFLATRLYVTLFLLAAFASGCAQKKVAVEKSAAIAAAERLEHRASNAYAKGDAIGAAKDFQMAGQVYESLAMTDAAAAVQLSLARIDSDEGRIKEAVQRVEGVTAVATQAGVISASTALLANGRAAALYLQQQNNMAADRSLSAAERLCAGACEASSALLTLRANWFLATGDATNAKAKATSGLAQSQNPNDKANALRSLAESGLALNQLPQAANDAEQALQIDQTQGSSLRVIADLKLLTLIHAKAGNADKSRAYAELGQTASLARSQLISK